MASIRRLLTPWETDRLSFAFNDPKTYNTDGSVNPNTFVKVLDQLEGRGKLSDDSLVKLVEVFTSKCNRQEWKEFYQPVLQRKQDHGLVISLANEWLSDEHKVRVFDLQEMQMGFPETKGYFYPWEEDWLQRYIIVWGNYIESMGDDFEHWSTFNCERDFQCFLDQGDVSYPLVFEGFSDGDNIMLTDMFELKNIGTWPGEMRRRLLEEGYQLMSDKSDCNYTSLGEGYPGDENTDLSEVKKYFEELGYTDMSAVLFKPAESTYTSPALLVPVHSVDGVDGETVTT